MLTERERRRPLTVPQEKFLVDLLEPNRNPGNVWYFPARYWPTANCLMKLGLVKQEDEGSIRRGFSLTPTGRMRAKEIAEEAGQVELERRHAV